MSNTGSSDTTKISAMLKVGLTGNIGSGKSVVSKVFSSLGIPVYHADLESKKFLETEDVRSRITGLFGRSTLSASGNIDRAGLGRIVFSDAEALRSLNEILHPLVMEDFIRWCNTHEEIPYVIQEAAIILESGYKDYFDKIIHVSCPRELAVRRVMTRDRVSEKEVTDRMKYQMDDKEKAAIADFVIRNDGSDLVIPQVLLIHEKLLQVPA
jgi:dephospho-CoA kinase